MTENRQQESFQRGIRARLAATRAPHLLSPSSIVNTTTNAATPCKPELGLNVASTRLTREVSHTLSSLPTGHEARVAQSPAPASAQRSLLERAQIAADNVRSAGPRGPFQQGAQNPRAGKGARQPARSAGTRNPLSSDTRKPGRRGSAYAVRTRNEVSKAKHEDRENVPTVQIDMLFRPSSRGDAVQKTPKSSRSTSSGATRYPHVRIGSLTSAPLTNRTAETTSQVPTRDVHTRPRSRSRSSTRPRAQPTIAPVLSSFSLRTCAAAPRKHEGDAAHQAPSEPENIQSKGRKKFSRNVARPVDEWAHKRMRRTTRVSDLVFWANVHDHALRRSRRANMFGGTDVDNATKDSASSCGSEVLKRRNRQLHILVRATDSNVNWSSTRAAPSFFMSQLDPVVVMNSQGSTRFPFNASLGAADEWQDQLLLRFHNSLMEHYEGAGKCKYAPLVALACGGLRHKLISQAEHLYQDLCKDLMQQFVDIQPPQGIDHQWSFQEGEYYQIQRMHLCDGSATMVFINDNLTRELKHYLLHLIGGAPSQHGTPLLAARLMEDLGPLPANAELYVIACIPVSMSAADRELLCALKVVEEVHQDNVATAIKRVAQKDHLGASPQQRWSRPSHSTPSGVPPTSPRLRSSWQSPEHHAQPRNAPHSSQFLPAPECETYHVPCTVPPTVRPPGTQEEHPATKHSIIPQVKEVWETHAAPKAERQTIRLPAESSPGSVTVLENVMMSQHETHSREASESPVTFSVEQIRHSHPSPWCPRTAIKPHVRPQEPDLRNNKPANLEAQKSHIDEPQRGSVTSKSRVPALTGLSQLVRTAQTDDSLRPPGRQRTKQSDVSSPSSQTLPLGEVDSSQLFPDAQTDHVRHPSSQIREQSDGSCMSSQQQPSDVGDPTPRFEVVQTDDLRYPSPRRRAHSDNSSLCSQQRPFPVSSMAEEENAVDSPRSSDTLAAIFRQRPSNNGTLVLFSPANAVRRMQAFVLECEQESTTGVSSTSTPLQAVFSTPDVCGARARPSDRLASLWKQLNMHDHSANLYGCPGYQHGTSDLGDGAAGGAQAQDGFVFSLSSDNMSRVDFFDGDSSPSSGSAKHYDTKNPQGSGGLMTHKSKANSLDAGVERAMHHCSNGDSRSTIFEDLPSRGDDAPRDDRCARQSNTNGAGAPVVMQPSTPTYTRIGQTNPDVEAHAAGVLDTRDESGGTRPSREAGRDGSVGTHSDSAEYSVRYAGFPFHERAAAAQRRSGSSRTPPVFPEFPPTGSAAAARGRSGSSRTSPGCHPVSHDALRASSSSGSSGTPGCPLAPHDEAAVSPLTPSGSCRTPPGSPPVSFNGAAGPPLAPSGSSRTPECPSVSCNESTASLSAPSGSSKGRDDPQLSSDKATSSPLPRGRAPMSHDEAVTSFHAP